MPCRSDYLEPHGHEREIGKLLLLIEEVETGVHVDPAKYKIAYEYGSRGRLDEVTADLCEKMQEVENPSKCSLELQIWWRDHQEWDKRRQEQERRDKLRESVKKKALAKLSPTERKALGLN